MTFIKICGITNFEDALAAVRFGADAIGLNFFKGSPRYIEPETARYISENMPEKLVKVGVFVNAEIDEIAHILTFAGLDAIQLHGDESPQLAKELKSRTGAPVIRAFRVSTEFDAMAAEQFPADAILLDAHSSAGFGGTGETFDWTIANKIRGRVKQLYLAGGLTESNVVNAIEAVNPFAVDACSGLESSPGRKDPSKLAAFIKAVRNI